MKQKLEALLVGCGGMSNAWLSVAEKEDDLGIAGLMDINRRNAEGRASEYDIGGECVFDDLDAALEQTDPDVVFDCSVPEAHYKVTMKALSAGCHVLGEKPLADSMDHAHQMVEKARESERIYAVMQNRRYLPSAPAMAQLISDGVIGDTTTVNVDFYIGAHFSGFRTEMQHPLLLDMAIHTFDQARQFTGADPREVYCRAFNPMGSWYEGKASAHCIFQMTDDIVFNYRGSWCSEGYNTPWAGSWRVVGTKGTALWDEGTPRAQVVEHNEGEFMSELKEVESETPPLETTGHAACIREFLNCIRKGEIPQTNCRDNIKSLAMVFGAIESDAAGRPIEIEVPAGIGG